jgi:hypothetical protein
MTKGKNPIKSNNATPWVAPGKAILGQSAKVKIGKTPLKQTLDAENFYLAR